MASLSEMLQYAQYQNELNRQKSGAAALEQPINTLLKNVSQKRESKEMAELARNMEEQTGQDLFPKEVVSMLEEGKATPQDLAQLGKVSDTYLRSKYQRERLSVGQDILSQRGTAGTTQAARKGGATVTKTIPTEAEIKVAEAKKLKALADLTDKEDEAYRQTFNEIFKSSESRVPGNAAEAAWIITDAVTERTSREEALRKLEELKRKRWEDWGSKEETKDKGIDIAGLFRDIIKGMKGVVPGKSTENKKTGTKTKELNARILEE